ncbi:hypothetical protein OROGR_010037 [Orobanche gracilis]
MVEGEQETLNFNFFTLAESHRVPAVSNFPAVSPPCPAMSGRVTESDSATATPRKCRCFIGSNTFRFQNFVLPQPSVANSYSVSLIFF